MVSGWLALPSLPRLPQGLVDFLDTSPQVFYPPSRPSSRGGAATSAASCPSSPSPRRRPRPLSMGDARVLFTQASPLPPFNPLSHPQTDSPLETSREHRGSLPEQSPHTLSQSMFGPPPPPPPPPPTLASSRPSHRRSQSLAPAVASYSAATLSPATRARGFSETRNPLTSTSAASLPTLDEDAEGHRPPHLNEPIWQQSLRRTQTLPRGRRGIPQVLATAPLEDTRSRRNSSVTHQRNSSVTQLGPISTGEIQGGGTAPRPPMITTAVSSGGSPRRPRSFVRRESANSLVFPEPPHSPSPMLSVSASTSVSDIAAVATWSEPVPGPRTLSRSQSYASDRLRERLRSLNRLESSESLSRRGSVGSALGGQLSPVTPRSSHAQLPAVTDSTPKGPRESRTPGSSTPKTAGTAAAAAAPLSPTPTRQQRPPCLSHNKRFSLPDALILVTDTSSRPRLWSQSSHTASYTSFASQAQTLRPTASRMRQPAPFQMASAAAPSVLSSTNTCCHSRRDIMLETPMSPQFSSSPGSMVSDLESGTEGYGSPTTSIEDLTLESGFSHREHETAQYDHPVSEQSRDGHAAGAEQHRPSGHDLLRSSRTSRDIRELTDLRESLRHSTSSLRTGGAATSRTQSLRESSHPSLRESSSRSTIREDPSTRSARTAGHSRHNSFRGAGHTLYSQAHPLNTSTSSFVRERRDPAFAKDPLPLHHPHPTHGTRVVPTYDPSREDRFLDFDDI